VARRTVLDHQAAKVFVEGARAIVGKVGELGCCGRKAAEETVADFDEEAKANAPPEIAVGDDEEDETPC